MTRFVIDRLFDAQSWPATHRIGRKRSFGWPATIGPDHVLDVESVGGKVLPPITIGELVAQLTADKEGQAPEIHPVHANALGRFMGELLWRGEDRDDEVDELVIGTDDPFIAGLPWPLVCTRNMPPLGRQGIPVSLEFGQPCDAAGLPDRPRVLIVAPTPDNKRPTNARMHVEALRDRLSRFCEISDSVPVSRQEFLDALTRFKPNILYYYGHGELDLAGLLQLIMEASPDLSLAAPMDITDVSDVLVANPAVTSALALVYLNCCWGGVPGAAGGPATIGQLVPVLISNRTSAIIPAAREQALLILHRIIALGVAPDDAVAQVAQEALGLQDWAKKVQGAPREPWWLTPTVYRRCTVWSAQKQAPTGEEIFSDRETLLLNRGGHWIDAQQAYSRANKPVVLLLWGGADEDGRDPLAERLHWEFTRFNQSLRVHRLCAPALEWPWELPHVRRKLIAPLAERVVRAVFGRDPTDDDKRALAERALSLMGSRRGIALLEFASIPLRPEITPDEALKRSELQVSECLAFLDEWLGQPLRQSDGDKRVRIVALLRLASSPSCDVGKVIQKFAGLEQETVSVSALNPLTAVTPGDIVNVLTGLRSRSSDLAARMHKISENIFAQTHGGFEATRRAIKFCDQFAD